MTVFSYFRFAGFYHEQARPDRDNYVEIIERNIAKGMLGNFAKLPESRVDMLREPYDYNSIMHYGQGDFAVTPGLTTIRALRVFDGKMGQRSYLSAVDVRKLNVAYECGGYRSLSALPNRGYSVINDTIIL